MARRSARPATSRRKKAGGTRWWTWRRGAVASRHGGPRHRLAPNPMPAHRRAPARRCRSARRPSEMRRASPGRPRPRAPAGEQGARRRSSGRDAAFGAVRGILVERGAVRHRQHLQPHMAIVADRQIGVVARQRPVMRDLLGIGARRQEVAARGRAPLRSGRRPKWRPTAATTRSAAPRLSVRAATLQ